MSVRPSPSTRNTTEIWVSRVLRSTAARRAGNAALATRRLRDLGRSSIFSNPPPVRTLARMRRQPQFHRTRMALEAFQPRQPCDLGTEPFKRGRRGLDYTGSLDKIVSTQRRGEAGRTAGGKDVIRSGKIVAQRSGRVTADENRACGLHLLEPAAGVGEVEFEMLRGDTVGEVERLRNAFDDYRGAPFGQRTAHRLGPRQIDYRVVERRRRGLREFAR